MPIRILSVHRRATVDRCIGCGRLGARLCPWCKELQDATLSRIAKLLGTLEWRFAENKYW